MAKYARSYSYDPIVTNVFKSMKTGIQPGNLTHMVSGMNYDDEYFEVISGEYVQVRANYTYKGRVFFTKKAPQTIFVAAHDGYGWNCHRLARGNIIEIKYLPDQGHPPLEDTIKYLKKSCITWLDQVHNGLTPDDLLEYVKVTVEHIATKIETVQEQASCNLCKKYSLLNGICREGCGGFSLSCFERA